MLSILHMRPPTNPVVILQASGLLWVRCFQLCKTRISTYLETSRYSFNTSPENCYSTVVRVLMLNRKAVMKIYYDIKNNPILTVTYTKTTASKA